MNRIFTLPKDGPVWARRLVAAGAVMAVASAVGLAAIGVLRAVLR